MCTGLSARPFFAARCEVMLQLVRLATDCRDAWVRRPWAPARMRPPLDDRSLMDYYPRPLEGGPPLLPFARRPPPGAAQERPARGSAAQRPPGAGSGTQSALCLEHGAPSCPGCRSRGWGISRCCRAGHEGHADPSAGPRCPKARPGSHRAATCSCPRPGTLGGGAVLLARPGPPHLPSPPSRGPPSVSPVHPPAPPKTLDAHIPSALGPEDSRPPKRPKPDLLADQGGGGGGGSECGTHPTGRGGSRPGGLDAAAQRGYLGPPRCGQKTSGSEAGGSVAGGGEGGCYAGGERCGAGGASGGPASGWALVGARPELSPAVVGGELGDAGGRSRRPPVP